MTSKLELREIIDFHPVLLYEEDLLELEKLLLDSYTHKNDTITFELTHKERHFSASTVRDLLKFEALPESTDRLSIRRNGWVEEAGKVDINRGINLTLHHTYINCQIFSYDEDWYKGKLLRLKEFFRKRKPWYSFLNKISPIFPSLAVLSLTYLIILIKDEKLILAIAPSCLFILLTVVSILTFQQRIFPFVKIVLKKREKTKFGLDEFQALIVIVAGLVTILQFIYTLLSNKK